VTNPRSGIDETNRARLETLHRETTGPFTVARAADLLPLDREQTRHLLVYLAARGWLSRIRPGLYTTVPLGATAPTEWREDAWAIAVSTFAPCYIGGWSAGEYWNLTEQIFRDIVVVTGTPLRRKKVTIQGTRFYLKFLPEAKHFGTRTVWRQQTRVPVSDPSRTMVDILDDPRLGGGIRHAAQMLQNYFTGKDRNDQRLLDDAERLGNRSVFKRLGFLAEALKIAAPDLIEECRCRRSSGLSTLDPAIPSPGRIVRRWNLRVNVTLQPDEEAS